MTTVRHVAEDVYTLQDLIIDRSKPFTRLHSVLEFIPHKRIYPGVSVSHRELYYFEDGYFVPERGDTKNFPKFAARWSVAEFPEFNFLDPSVIRVVAPLYSAINESRLILEQRKETELEHIGFANVIHGDYEKQGKAEYQKQVERSKVLKDTFLKLLDVRYGKEYVSWINLNRAGHKHPTELSFSAHDLDDAKPRVAKLGSLCSSTLPLSSPAVQKVKDILHLHDFLIYKGTSRISIEELEAMISD